MGINFPSKRILNEKTYKFITEVSKNMASVIQYALWQLYTMRKKKYVQVALKNHICMLNPQDIFVLQMDTIQV